MSQNASGILNQTGRSYSNISGRPFQSNQQMNQMGSNTSGKTNNQSSGVVAIIPEAHLIESEEAFESGKVFLAEQKYKDAVKMFGKSLTLNQTNFDALFYRAVSNLDSGQP